VLGQFVAARAWGVNYLLGVGPTSDGVFPQTVYDNMKVIGDWIKQNRRSVEHVQQLPLNETASVPATAKGNYRYLFAIPEFKDGGKYDQDRLPAKDQSLIFRTVAPPKMVSLVASGQKLNYTYANGEVSISLPASVRTSLVDVVQIELEQ
jgi:alpha-L-fucosidase